MIMRWRKIWSLRRKWQVSKIKNEGSRKIGRQSFGDRLSQNLRFLRFFREVIVTSPVMYHIWCGAEPCDHIH